MDFNPDLYKGHTPGPWEHDADYNSACGTFCTPDGCHEGHFSGTYDLLGPEVAERGEFVKEADARLLADAPKLLKIIEELLKTQGENSLPLRL